jgi:hypothetical protein
MPEPFRGTVAELRARAQAMPTRTIVWEQPAINIPDHLEVTVTDNGFVWRIRRGLCECGECEVLEFIGRCIERSPS